MLDSVATPPLERCACPCKQDPISEVDSAQINVNSWCRDPYVEALHTGLASKPFPEAQEDATEVFAKNCEKFFKLFGSEGKA